MGMPLADSDPFVRTLAGANRYRGTCSVDIARTQPRLYVEPNFQGRGDAPDNTYGRRFDMAAFDEGDETRRRACFVGKVLLGLITAETDGPKAGAETSIVHTASLVISAYQRLTRGEQT